MLDHEELVEQAYFFRALHERLKLDIPLQDLLSNLREEALSSTRLPLAIDYMISELVHSGVFGPALSQLGHYFTPFQSFVVNEAERDEGRFDLRTGLVVLQREAEYRAGTPTQAGIFLYQFETISRNRLRYDPGLAATCQDPIFDDDWRQWLKNVRRQVGIVDLTYLVYRSSQYYVTLQQQRGLPVDDSLPVLFGEKEGKIAYSNQRKEPLLMLAALHRHLGYPAVPRPAPPQDNPDLIPQLSRRIERLESRLKIVEDEQKGGVDITQFYVQPDRPNPPPPS